MLRILLVLPGSTELDRQKRITGSLDVPLNVDGTAQARKTAQELGGESIEVIYCSPCQAARQTAEQLSRGGRIRVKVLDDLTNLDHGLWQGKSIEELKDGQPRVYRQFQENPETVCPPNGETLEKARARLARVILKAKRKFKTGTVALVVPEPAASILRCYLSHGEVGDMWKAECRSGGWESILVPTDTVA